MCFLLHNVLLYGARPECPTLFAMLLLDLALLLGTRTRREEGV